ncbi:hypothetical protein M5K25_008039 [Dendrobium thyrsiflorum]|uniref:Uncharacterized protein n=1 Tax=Dendrobium thyrsiflorum TaxID=117978 RepID=A0ABD0V7Q2_DENTH
MPKALLLSLRKKLSKETNNLQYCVSLNLSMKNSSSSPLLFLLLLPLLLHTTESQSPIKTVVILVLENRSFDHMLGYLKQSLNPSINGLTGAECNPLSASSSICVSDDAGFVESDPGHSFQAVVQQVFGSSTIPSMSGFAQQASTVSSSLPLTVMQCFDPQTLPVFSTLVDEFAVFDLPKLKLGPSELRFEQTYSQTERFKITNLGHQNQLNPSPNEFKSRHAYSRIERLDKINPTSLRTLNSDITKSVKCLVNIVHPNHFQLTLDLSHIYKPCHSKKSINKASLSHEKGSSQRKRSKREIGCSCLLAPTRPPPEVPSDHRLTLEQRSFHPQLPANYGPFDLYLLTTAFSTSVTHQIQSLRPPLPTTVLPTSVARQQQWSLRPPSPVDNGLSNLHHPSTTVFTTSFANYDNGLSDLRCLPITVFPTTFARRLWSLRPPLPITVLPTSVFRHRSFRPPSPSNNGLSDLHHPPTTVLTTSFADYFLVAVIRYLISAIFYDFNYFLCFIRNGFSSIPGPTQPNRLFLYSATSNGATTHDPLELLTGYPQKTIFDSLHENLHDFAVYFSTLPTTLFYARMRKLEYASKFHWFSAFRAHAKAGKLAKLSVIEPRYFDLVGAEANDDHPAHDVMNGQRLVKEVYEMLRGSPQWNESLLIVSYDEHGGFYDHVETPYVGVPNPDGMRGPAPFLFDFDRLGVRVPTIMVSPWIKKGTVVSRPNGPTANSEYEHSSIPATLKKIFGLKSDFLTKRDAWAGTFEHIFEELSSPRTDCPEILPSPFPTRSSTEIKEDSFLSEFQAELVDLASVLSGDSIFNLHSETEKKMTVKEADAYVKSAIKNYLKASKEATH